MRLSTQSSYLFAVFVLLLPCGAFAQAGDKPVIESIEGEKIVVIKTPQGNRVGQKGSEVDIGDKIKTGPRASAKIRYPDGSKLLIGKGTEVEIQESGEGVQFSQLNSGEVRGLIKKPKLKKGEQGPPRFIIRSRSAVMGVRGTDFVFNVAKESAAANLYTLDGSVEVAKTEEALLSGEGVTVAKDQYVNVDAQGVKPPQVFDRAKYEAYLQTEQPTFVSFVENDPEVRAMQSSHQSLDEALKEEGEGAPRRDGDNREKGNWKFLRLLNFRATSVYYKQQSGGSYLTVQASWNPVLNFFNVVSLRPHVGVSPIKSRQSGETKPGLEIGALVALPFIEPILIEAGAGGKDLGGNSAGGPVVMLNGGWKLSNDKLLERIYLGTALFNQIRGSGDSRVYNPTLEVKAGVGFQF